MIFLKLFLTFIKIGLFSFGGGYAMIPLIQKEIELNGWLTPSEFVDIIAISEMTPGPVAVNSATFVGYKAAGFLGGAVATLGVALPSMVLILLISRYFFKFQKHPVKVAAFYGIRPVIAGLIIAAAIFVAETSLFKLPFSAGFFTELVHNPLGVINLGSAVILAITMLAIMKFKVHPILAIALSAAMGIIFFYVL